MSLMIFITCFKRIIFLIGTPVKLLKIWAALVWFVEIMSE